MANVDVFASLSPEGLIIAKLEARVARLEKTLKKAAKRERDVAAADPNAPPKKPRAPSGFAKPAPVSADLAAFMGVEADALVARTAATQRINAYIKEHNLQDPENKRLIQLDPTLRALLRVPDDTPISCFTLQKFLKIHYPKKDASPDSESTTTAPTLTVNPLPPTLPVPPQVVEPETSFAGPPAASSEAPAAPVKKLKKRVAAPAV